MNIRRKYQILLILLVFSFFLLLCCGADGWLRMPYPHVDSSWFFMAGKAWANGQTPYVDFTDSKGPLLWLIYRIGYFLSPNSFHGVFWIGVLAYWATFWFLYKTSLILLKDSSKALLAVFISVVFFFIPGIHYEIRAEDYCQVFFAILFYVLVSVAMDRKFSSLDGFLSGMALGASFLIKYNITGMLGVIEIFILIFLFRNVSAAKYIRWFWSALGGIIAILLPFVVWFALSGNLSAFVSEYFVNTFNTIGRMTGVPGALPDGSRGGFLALLISRSWIGIVLKMAVLLVAWLPLKVYKNNRIRIAIWVSFLVAALSVTSVVHEYYLNSLATFCFFGVVSAVSYLRRVNMEEALLAGAIVIALLVIAGNSFFGKGEFSDVKGALYRQRQDEYITRVMKSYGETYHCIPTIAYIGLMDRGEHIASGALPGIKYWAYQNGSTPDMEFHNREDAFKMRPDFIFVAATRRELQDSLINSGYTHITNYYIDTENPDSSLLTSLYMKTLR